MKRLLLFTLPVCVMLLHADTSLACLCKPETTSRAVSRLRKEATIIFLGTARDVVKEGRSFRATFTVEKQWKAAPTQEIDIYTDGGCMAWFEAGRSYLIFAVRGASGRMETDVCMRSRLTEYATEELKHLGKPKSINNPAVPKATRTDDKASRRQRCRTSNG